jgi:hypothetical protein
MIPNSATQGRLLRPTRRPLSVACSQGIPGRSNIRGTPSKAPAERRRLLGGHTTHDFARKGHGPFVDRQLEKVAGKLPSDGISKAARDFAYQGHQIVSFPNGRLGALSYRSWRSLNQV